MACLFAVQGKYFERSFKLRKGDFEISDNIHFLKAGCKIVSKSTETDRSRRSITKHNSIVAHTKGRTEPPWLYYGTKHRARLNERHSIYHPCQRLPILVSTPKEKGFTSSSPRRTDSVVRCHSTVSHFALIQSSAWIQFGNCCRTSNPSNWHFQSEPEKCITLNLPKNEVLTNNLKLEGWDLPAAQLSVWMTAALWKQINRLSFVYSFIQWSWSRTWKVLDLVDTL